MSVLMELTASHTRGQHHMEEEMNVLDTRAPSGSWGDPQLCVGGGFPPAGAELCQPGSSALRDRPVARAGTMKSSSTLLLLTLLSLLAGVLAADPAGDPSGDPPADPPDEDPDSSPSDPSPSDSSPSDLTTQEDPSVSNNTSDGPGSSPTPEYNATDDPTSPPSPVSPSHAPTTTTPTTTTTTTTRTTTTTTEGCMFPRTQGRVVLMVAGALTVACVGLLVTTALLTWKLCRRRREAEPDSDLISNSEFWMGSARRDKARRPPAKDTCLLLGLLETKEGQRGAGGEGGEEQEGKGGEGEADAEANGTAGVLAPAGGPSESGGGSGEAV
ncbi:unnamed protein product [Arctogadus glacialis]